MRTRTISYFCALLCITVLIFACQDQNEIDFQNYKTSGKDIYKAKCQNCHAENGEGLGALAPPLTDTTYLKAHKNKLACFIKNGLQDTIVVHGKTYSDKMPGFKELTDIEIAQLIVYITNSFGNTQGHYPYSQVSEDLKNCIKP